MVQGLFTEEVRVDTNAVDFKVQGICGWSARSSCHFRDNQSSSPAEGNIPLKYSSPSLSLQ